MALDAKHLERPRRRQPRVIRLAALARSVECLAYEARGDIRWCAGSLFGEALSSLERLDNGRRLQVRAVMNQTLPGRVTPSAPPS